MLAVFSRYFYLTGLACVASISNWVIAWKLKRGQKKKDGRGEGRRGNAGPQTPWFWKTLLDISWFCSVVNWQLVKTDNRLPDLKNWLCSLKHSPSDCKTVIKRSFTIKEGWKSERLQQNFLFFIVKLHFERYVALSHLKTCQNVANKWFVWNNSLHRLWVLINRTNPIQINIRQKHL